MSRSRRHSPQADTLDPPVFPEPVQQFLLALKMATGLPIIPWDDRAPASAAEIRETMYRVLRQLTDATSGVLDVLKEKGEPVFVVHPQIYAIYRAWHQAFLAAEDWAQEREGGSASRQYLTGYFRGLSAEQIARRQYGPAWAASNQFRMCLYYFFAKGHTAPPLPNPPAPALPSPVRDRILRHLRYKVGRFGELMKLFPEFKDDRGRLATILRELRAAGEVIRLPKRRGYISAKCRPAGFADFTDPLANGQAH